MSIGFIGNNYQSSQDVNSNGSRLELSLQNVLDRYDVIRNSDLDRLSSNAFYNTYDITSRQHYNTYNAEAVSGWAESWYSEYRTVLQMRADSLQKKLQASYNRVMEKAVYTELEPDRKSVFAPYANRTDSLTQTNFTGPISEVLLHDTDSLAPVVPVVVTPPVNSFTTLDAYLQTMGIITAPNAPVAAPYFSSITNLRNSQYQAFHDAITDSYAKSIPPIVLPSTNPAEVKKAKNIADVAIKSLTELMKPQTVNGYDIVPADTFTGFGKNAPLRVSGAPPGNIPIPPSTSSTINYNVWDPTLDVDSTPLPAVAFGNVVANAPVTLAEDQSIATPTPSAPFTGNGYLADGMLSDISIVALNADPIGSPLGGVDDRNLVIDRTRLGIFSVPLNLSAGYIVPGGSNGGPESVILPDTPANSNRASSYFNGDAYLTVSGSGTKSSEYYKRSEIIQNGSGPTDTWVFYLDDLPPSNSSMSSQIQTRIENNSFSAYKNGVADQQLSEFPPKNSILYFKTRYPSSWYFNGDPRLGITGQAGTTPDNHALPLSGIPQDLINRNYDRPAAGGIEGWTAGNGLYTAIRSGTEAINNASNVLNGIPAGPPVTSTVPDPAGYKYEGGGGVGSDSIYDVAIGDAAYDENSGDIAKNYSNLRRITPAFGGGNDVNVADLFKDLPANITDTLLKDPTVVADLNSALNDIKRSFVGRQYDDILKGNAYTGDYTSMDVSVMAGVEIGPIGTNANASPLAALVATEKAVNKAGVSYTLAGSSNALTTDSKFYAVGVGPDLNLGHASAVSEGNLRYGTVGLASGAFSIPIPIPLPPPVAIALTLWLGGKTQVTEDVVAHTIVDFFSKIKTIMVEYMQTQAYSASSGTVFDTYASKAENHFNEVGFVEGLKKIEINLLGVTIPIGKMIGSIVKGNGTGGSDGMADVIAMGASPLAGEAYSQTLNKANEGTRMFEVKQGVQTPETRETDTGAFFATQSFLSQFSMKEMESEYWIGTQQNEEVVDTDFLRSLSTVGTMFLNTMQTLLQLIGGSPDSGQSSTAVAAALAAGKMLVDASLEKDKINLWNNLFFKDQDQENDLNNAADLAISSPDAALNIVLGATEALPKAATTFLPYDPTTGALVNGNFAPPTGSVAVLAGGQVINSSFKMESYDYLESDHKPFEGDSTFSYPDPPTSMLGVLAGAVGLNGIKDALKAFKPENIMEGYAATMRFQSKTAASGGAAEQMSLADLTTPIDHNLANGIGVRAQAGRGTTNGSDGTIWTDTALGDINEVYVGTRKVVFNNLENGFNTFNAATLEAAKINDTGAAGASGVIGDTVSGSTASRQTSATAQRYIGADTRAYGRNYDGGGTPNLESFTTNLYTAGGVKYDRKNQYSLSFTTSASGKKLDLQGAQALNPFIGGFIKMSEIEKNKNDSVLMNYDDIDTVNKVRWDSIRDNLGNVVTGNQSATAAATVRKAGATLENTKNIVAYSADDQQFGGSADGTMNELNKTLYEHMHLRADGQNLSLFKEYKDVFNMGYMKNIFITGQSYHPSGGGMTSSIEIRYDPSGGANINKVQDDTRENFNKSTNVTSNYVVGNSTLNIESVKDLFVNQKVNIGGNIYTILSINGAAKSITLTSPLIKDVPKDSILIPATEFDPYNSITLEKTRGKASVYLNNYFASKKRASSK